jgi:hypothetical protein
MAITAQAPLGGVSWELGGETRSFLLRQGEIERFERQHKLGIFALFNQVMAHEALSIHVRDIVALGLVGAGMTDKSADALIGGLPAHENMGLQVLATQILMAAFVDPAEVKKNAEDGSLSDPTSPTATSAKKKSQTVTKPD